MKQRPLFFILMIAMMSIASFLWVTPVSAQENPPVPPAPQGQATPPAPIGGVAAVCPNSGIFTERIVKCVQAALETTVQTYLLSFSDYIRPAILAAITLSITLFGVQLLMGASQITMRTFSLLFKIAIVFWLTDNFGGLTPAVYNTMEDLQTIVTSSLVANDPQCPAPANETVVVWSRLDCLTGKLFGFGPEVSKKAGVLGIVGASLFSGAMGVQLFATAFGAYILILLMVFRAVYTFLLAYSAVAFLILISPLMIPMMVFKVTQSYFSRWLSQLMAAMLEPIILFAFLSFFFVTMGNVVNQIQDLGTASRQFYVPDRQFFSLNSMFDPSVLDKITKGGLNVVSPSSGQSTPLLAKGSNLGDAFRLNVMDAGTRQFDMLFDFISRFASVIIISYLMMKMIEHIPTLAKGMIGMSSSTSVGEGKTMPFEGRLNKALGDRKQGMEQAAQGSGGGLEGLSAFTTKSLPRVVTGGQT